MCERPAPSSELWEIAEVNPEALPGNTQGNFAFRYVDLSAADRGTIDWGNLGWTTLREAPSRARRVTRSGDALFGTVRPYLQSHGYVPDSEEGPIIASTGFSVVRARKGASDPAFLFHTLMGSAVLEQANRHAIGSSYPAVTEKDVARFRVYSPSPIHQAKIAEVLDTLDAAIRGTEAVVAKLRAMKQGLMHDLLTRGINANGDLRPPQPEAPHLYHQTPLGWLPREWDWGKLEDYCSRICVGIVIKPADHYVDEGVPTLRSANVREGYISESDFVYISTASNAMLNKSQIRKGDILTVRTGYPGTSAVVPEEYDGCNCVDILISTPIGSISSEFLCNWINSPFGKGQVLSGQGGLAQQHFNVGEMRELIVVKPRKTEQDEITSRIDTAEGRIQTEQNILNKLRLQKSGLMDDLLTGRVPVTALL